MHSVVSITLGVQSRGVHHPSGIFILRGGGYTTSVEYLSTWGGGYIT